MDSSTPPRADALTAAARAAVAGCIDALGFVTLGGILVAHMSGDTAVGALKFERRIWSEALARLSPLPDFLVGTVIGNVAARALSRGGRFALGVAVLLHLGILSAALVLSWRGVRAPLLMVTLLVLTMGLQGASLRRIAGHEVRTTFVTGMLVAFVDELSDRWLVGSKNTRPGLHIAVWCAFFAGALIGAASTQ